MKTQILYIFNLRDGHGPPIRNSSVDNCYGPSFRLSTEGYNVQSRNSNDAFIKPPRPGESPLQPSSDPVIMIVGLIMITLATFE
ncbi:2375_t:CDS:2, partial [Racocetra fulgida]